MRNFINKGLLGGAVLAGSLVAGNADAALDLSTVTVDMSPITGLYSGVIIVALLVMFVIRKATKTTNRS